MGFEPTTSSLGSWHSTTELRPHIRRWTDKDLRQPHGNFRHNFRHQRESLMLLSRLRADKLAPPESRPRNEKAGNGGFRRPRPLFTYRSMVLGDRFGAIALDSNCSSAFDHTNVSAESKPPKCVNNSGPRPAAPSRQLGFALDDTRFSLAFS